MLRTRICDLLGIEHPVVLGGMGGGTSPRLVGEEGFHEFRPILPP